MDAWIADTIRRHARPLEPLPTGQAEQLEGMLRPEAVLFDIYGTLVISGCGDIGVTSAGQSDMACDALAAVGLLDPIDGASVVSRLRETIARRHDAARNGGRPYPEVDIVSVWEETLDALVAADALPRSAREIDCRRLAVEYEVRTNPVWPMPGASECLAALAQAGLILGVVSNAQFFTPFLFPALMDRSLDVFGIPPSRQIYSYRYGRAKPDRYLFDLMEKELTGQAIGADRTIYVGNDMRNDIWPAAMTGMRTALFAGDRRSLRLRRDDPDVAACRPDQVVTDWHRFTETILSTI